MSGHTGYTRLLPFAKVQNNNNWEFAVQAQAHCTLLQCNVRKMGKDFLTRVIVLLCVTKAFYWYACEQYRSCQIDAKERCNSHYQNKKQVIVYKLSRVETYPPRHGRCICSDFLFNLPRT